MDSDQQVVNKELSLTDLRKELGMVIFVAVSLFSGVVALHMLGGVGARLLREASLTWLHV